MSKVLVYGGKGALGSTLVHHFKEKSWWVCSVDLGENPEADVNVAVKGSSLLEQADMVKEAVKTAVGENKLDAIFCVAGGWAGGNAADKDFVKNCDLMMKQSIWTSVISAQLAANFLKEGGLLQLTGAVPCLKGTSFMMGYGLAKAAVHQLTASLADKPAQSGLPSGASVLAILPVTLDTPMNRKFMPDADHTTWTPMSYVTDMFTAWCSDPASRHPTGSLVKLTTKDNVTEQSVV